MFIHKLLMAECNLLYYRLTNFILFLVTLFDTCEQMMTNAMLILGMSDDSSSKAYLVGEYSIF